MSAYKYGLSLLRRCPVPRLVPIMAAMILAAVGTQSAPAAARAPPIAGSRRRLPRLGLRAVRRSPQGDL